MTRDEIIDLLSVATAYDNRNRNEADVGAWHEAATRVRWTFNEALEAVHAHFSETSDYLMPGHITQRIRTGRQQPAPPSEAQPLPPGSKQTNRPAADPVHMRSIINAVGQQLGWHRDETEPDANRRALAVQCPHCHAVPGKPCARQMARGHKRGQFVNLAQPHPSRRDIAETE